jgi:hypothetical protein
MKSAKRGIVTSSAVEVASISAQGIRIVLDSERLLLPFDSFPWFREATIEQILHVEQSRPGHLRWPELDIDVDLDSVVHPERYPLVAAMGSGVTRKRAGSGGRRKRRIVARRAPPRSR